ncbi:hypothetical protein BaRGS_00000545, partial [Batillaria attramentaria]
MTQPKHILSIFLPCLLSCLPGARAFSSGVRDINSVCTDMIPGHNLSPQTREAPYTVQVLPSSDFLPGDSIKVVVASDAPFKGFLLTALSTDDGLPIGTAVITDSAQSKLVCSDGATATHTSSAEKSEVSINWVAPDDIAPGSSVIFRATVVMNYQTFWTNIDSVQITAKAPPTTPAPLTPPTSATTLSAPQSSTTTPTGSVVLPPGSALPPATTPTKFDQYLREVPECGQTLGCFNDCSSGPCTFAITWQDLGDGLSMTMTFRLPPSDKIDVEYWIAVGFSKDTEMGDDSVTECTIEGDTVLVKQSYNDGLFNSYLDNKHAALSEMSGGVVDGILHCKFKRQKYYEVDPLVFDLNDDYYLMVASGEAMNGNKFPHTTHPVVSEGVIDLQGNKMKTDLKDPQCSRTKGCIHDCDNGPCSYMITWRDTGDDLLMTMTFRLPGSGGDHWIAIGFSKDMHMGDDSVTECISKGGEVFVKQSFNDGLSNFYLEDKQAGIKGMRGSVTDGVMRCEFTRQKKYPDDPKVFDLNMDFYLLVATGEAVNGEKLPHTSEPTESMKVIDLQTYVDVSGKEPKRSAFIYVHGILMIVAWVLFTSIGITTAKYGKPMWPKFKPFGDNIWFHFHRTVMALTAVFTLLGIILMAVECEGYCKLPNDVLGKTYWPLHPPLGIFVLLLTLANPIMAFFRPGPKAANRHVFNWMHWGVGVLAWILASLTMFIGLDLQRTHAPPEAVHVMLVWGVYHILFIVAMEILPRPLARCFEVVVQSTVKRGKVYDLERVRKDNDGYIADETSTDGTVTATRINDTSSVPSSDVTANKLPAKVNKEMSRDIRVEEKGKRNGYVLWTGVTVREPDQLKLPYSAGLWTDAIVISNDHVTEPDGDRTDTKV